MADAEIESACQAAIAAGKINGAILTATDAQGSFTYEKSLGERILLSGEKLPQQSDDVCFLASATKLLGTIAALQCVEDGLISLTGDVSSIAPELAAKQVITSFPEDSETPVLEPRTSAVTLQMLLTHSAGTDYYFANPLVGRWKEKFSASTLRPDDKLKVEELFDQPLGYQPGTSWLYGPGLDWAGRIVERLTGKRLGDRMHERIFAPLGIADAQFFPVTREDLRKRLIDLNPSDPDAVGRAVLGGGGDLNRHSSGHFGGQGLFMTTPDYLKVLRSLLANNGRILKPETVDSMFEHSLSPEATRGLENAVETPWGPFYRVGTAPGSKVGFGLGGLLTLEDVEGWYGEKTLTWGGGLTFCWFIDRKNNLCGAGAFQATLPVDPVVMEGLKQAFRHDIYRKRAAWEQANRT